MKEVAELEVPAPPKPLLKCQLLSCTVSHNPVISDTWVGFVNYLHPAVFMQAQMVPADLTWHPFVPPDPSTVSVTSQK